MITVKRSTHWRPLLEDGTPKPISYFESLQTLHGEMKVDGDQLEIVLDHVDPFWAVSSWDRETAFKTMGTAGVYPGAQGLVDAYERTDDKEVAKQYQAEFVEYKPDPPTVVLKILKIIK